MSARIFNRNKKMGNWKQRGTVIAKRDEPRSYDIVNEKGNVIRRNRQHLIPTKEAFDTDRSESSDDFIDSPTYDKVQEISNDDNNGSVVDDVVEDEVLEDDNFENNDYVTRFGRVVQRPNRYGY